MTEWLFWGCLPFLAAALFTDIRHWRIPNVLTLFTLGIGLIMQMICNGWHGLLFAAMGAGTGLATLLILYWTGAVGAGDVKLFTAIGAWTGTLFTLRLLMYSVFIGALIGWVIVLFRREGGKRLRQMLGRTAGFLLLKEFSPLSRNSSELLRFPFMLAVFPAYLCSYFYM